MKNAIRHLTRIQLNNKLLKKSFFILFFFLTANVFGQNSGAGIGIVYLYGGGTFANLNTSLKFKLSEEVLEYVPESSSSIDLESDLDFPKTSRLFYFKAIGGRRLQIVATYFSLHRDGEKTLSRTFAIGDNSYTINAPVKAYLNTDYYGATLRYSFLRNPYVSAGLSLGGRYLKIGAGITADSMGYVFSENGNLNVPVVVPGIHASVSLFDNALIRGSLEYFTLKLGGTRGTVLEGQITAEYYFLKFLGAGIGYSITHLKADDIPDNAIYLERIDYSVGGPQAFIALRF